LILLDRDGVLNRLVIDAENGTIDSPLSPDQVDLLPEVPQALKSLSGAGYAVCVVSNQPAAAKGKTTRKNLERVHERVLELAQSAGGKIDGSFICFHRSEDGCACRKPKTGLLEEAIQRYPDISRSAIWIIGDGIPDIQAGTKLKLQTVYLGPQKSDAHRLFVEARCLPSRWEENLAIFVRHLLNAKLDLYNKGGIH
jgi:D-glycero-D-manno-heptose 1,7-bisphosphate phosphatase